MVTGLILLTVSVNWEHFYVREKSHTNKTGERM